MAFTRYKNKASVGMDYMLMTDKEGCEMGEALKIVGGRLTKCGATETPEFISVCIRKAGEKSTEEAAVERAMENIEYVTSSSANLVESNIGDKVTIAADGLKVTDVTDSGVFTISGVYQGKIRGYFRR